LELRLGGVTNDRHLRSKFQCCVLSATFRTYELLLNFWTLYKVRGIYSIEFKTKSESGVSMLYYPGTAQISHEFRFEILNSGEGCDIVLPGSDAK
jgi:hypothetical protein